MNVDELKLLVAQGESERLEFKKSTGELKAALETFSGFLNSNGGRVLFGVTPGGEIVGQEVTDPTLREVAEALKRFELPIPGELDRVDLENGRAVLVLTTSPGPMSPYLFNGRPFRRVASTTSLMPQSEYQRRLLQRDHARERWENQIAIGYRVKDLDATEIRQMVSDSIAAGRLLEQWTERQRRILHALRDGAPRRMGELLAVFDPPAPHQTIRDDLNLLRKLGQVISFGRGPGARWQLTPPPS